MKTQKQLKICLAASAGGHMSQLLKLLEHSDTWPVQPALYVTTADVLAVKLIQKGKPVYLLGECNRQHPFKAMAVLYRSLKVVLKERPDVVITTGALPIALLCLIAKLFGAKIVWIDSVANIIIFSMSGRLIRKFASLFITQWPDLAKQHRQVEYVGTIV